MQPSDQVNTVALQAEIRAIRARLANRTNMTGERAGQLHDRLGFLLCEIGSAWR